MNLSLVQTGTVMRSDFRQQRRRTGAFSLLELMIAVGLLTLIIAALYAMFDQTQKAFRQSLNQADLSEGGRSALDLMVRTIERAASPQVEDALHLVEVPALAISSTDCRIRAGRGRPIWYLVPDGVVQYVAKRGLYRGHTAPKEFTA
jgi:type II secretory pathway component PulJ